MDARVLFVTTAAAVTATDYWSSIRDPTIGQGTVAMRSATSSDNERRWRSRRCHCRRWCRCSEIVANDDAMLCCYVGLATLDPWSIRRRLAMYWSLAFVSTRSQLPLFVARCIGLPTQWSVSFFWTVTSLRVRLQSSSVKPLLTAVAAADAAANAATVAKVASGRNGKWNF